jgi:hypothetical protein
MPLRPRKPADPEPEPMLPEQFELALAATQIRALDLIEACKAVLVRNENGPDIAAQYNVKQSSIYRATKRIKEKWDEICAAEGWDYITLAIPRAVTPTLLAYQREIFKTHSDKKSKRGTRKKK